MKKLFFSIITLSVISITINAQVGINTTKPAATLDIVAKNQRGSSPTADGLLIPRVDRQRAQSMKSVETSTLIYINDISTGSQTGTATNIDSTGYYYFNGTAWVKLTGAGGSNTNIYNSDSTLTGNRIVTQNDKSLKFNSTITNAFSVDDKTFSVDAANNRVGIGTTTPAATLDLKGNMILGQAAATNQTSTYSTVVRDNVTGELKVSQSSTGNTFPISYITFELKNAYGDWVKDYNTKINSSDYTVAVIGSTFIDPTDPKGTFLKGEQEGFSPLNLSAFSSGGTWHITADYFGSKPTSRRNGNWTIRCLVISKSLIQTIPTVNEDMGGSNTKTAANPPSGL
ncbi:hypothetical protein [Chryseobacterium daeguense]|uniref:hypothetical protein n=1 Tax=Chryseobacterium daeguense TaxID=412438 RepID=UPI0003F6DB04|nr:hypothetical protein [Chryseobacterium daeguense]